MTTALAIHMKPQRLRGITVDRQSIGRMRRCNQCGDEKPLTAFPLVREFRLATCRWCMKPLRTCEWCGRETRQYRRIQDGDGYECYRESSCTATHQERPLVRLGREGVLEIVERCRWNISAAAREAGVSRLSLSLFLKHHASEEWAAAEPLRKLSQHHAACGRSRVKFKDASELIRAMHRYEGNMKRVADALGCHQTTVYQSLRRLAPDLYAELREQRTKNAETEKRYRQKRKQDPALHPRRRWSSRKNAV